MTPLALDLDHDGIRLLAATDGVWEVLGHVALDDDDVPGRMRALAAIAARRMPGGVETILVVPASQILYTTLPVDRGATLRDADIRKALSGRTPCPPDELVFDWRRDGDRIRVAALDVTTLDEAEEFAVTYGLNPIRFTAQPLPSQFPEPPDFGPTQFVRHRGTEPRRGDAPVAPEAAAPPLILPAIAMQPADADAGPRRRADPGITAGDAARAPRRNRIAVAVLSATATAAAVIWAAAIVLGPDGADRPSGTASAPASEPVPADRTVASVARTIDAAARPGDVAADAAGRVSRPPPPAVDLSLLQAPAPGPLAAPPPAGVAGADDVPTPTVTVRLASVDPLVTADTPSIPGRPLDEPGALAADDAWVTPPRIADPAPDMSDSEVMAALDPDTGLGDAFALSMPSADLPPAPAPGAAPEIVTAVERREDATASDPATSVTVNDGTAPSVPRARPGEDPIVAQTPDGETVILVQDPRLAGRLPRLRPDGLAERRERALLGGYSRDELQERVPRRRPVSAQMAAMADFDPTEATGVTTSRAPNPRAPRMAEIVAATLDAAKAAPEVAEEEVGEATVAAAPATPILPSTASVARRATIPNAIDLGKVNLVGVYGSPGNRRALVRLASGRYVKVQVGDRVDGGRVAAIGDDQMNLVKGGRRLVLRLPSG